MAIYKFKVGDASGPTAKRDTIQSIYYADDTDFFITAAQKGSVAIWNNKLKLQGSITLKVILKFNQFIIIL
jgi:WD repeat-containing protein 64